MNEILVICNTVMKKSNAFCSPQADHLRQQTLIHMSRILSTHQAARGLLALGEYFHRLRTLCSRWASRTCELP